jgi:hypothetical protein
MWREVRRNDKMASPLALKSGVQNEGVEHGGPWEGVARLSFRSFRHAIFTRRIDCLQPKDLHRTYEC